MRLARAALAGIAARGIRVPTYDPEALRPGLVHIGVGAFHRCHQADYTDDLRDAGAETRRTDGINLAPPSVAGALAAQDGLWSRTLADGAVRDIRVLGGLGRIVEDTDAAVALLAAPETEVVTMTVTEKGYCHVPATGMLDDRHPGIRADLTQPRAPVTLPGLLVAALARRRAAGLGGLPLLSCDNIPANGRLLGCVVTAVARMRDANLADWIAETCLFPSSMVDRIVPAATDGTRADASAALGLEDMAAVRGEPFRQWVIGGIADPRLPRWQDAGVEFVADAEPYERIKMRVLNAAQTTFAHLGCLLGLVTTRSAAADPELRAYVQAMLVDETASTLPDLHAMPVASYIATTFARLDNAAIRHACHQIATDGSQKIGQRLLGPALMRVEDGRACARLAGAAAGWAAYLCAATPRFGARWTPADPAAETVAECVARGGTADDIARRILALASIFSPRLAKAPDFAEPFTHALQAWLGPEPRDLLRRLG